MYLKQAPLKGWNFITTGNEDHHLHENMFGNFAWDISKSVNGSTFQNSGSHNQDYYVWEEVVHSPFKGTVADLMREDDDNPADPSLSSDLSSKGDGNYVLIHLHHWFYFSLIHLKKNSIPEELHIGSPIEVGDVLGQVGNSGVTYVPHLHMTLFYWSPDLQRMMSVPTFMNQVETQNPSQSFCELNPKKGQSLRSLRASLSCP